MPTNLEYQNQLQGIKAVHQTVKTVEKVAASRLHTIKIQAQQFSNQVHQISYIIKRLQLYTDLPSSPFNHNLKNNQKVMLVLTSDKGLVGGLFSHLSEFLIEHYYQDYNQIWVIGAKGWKILDQAGVYQAQQLDNQQVFQHPPDQTQIVSVIINNIQQEEVAVLDVVYFKNLSINMQKASFCPLLPITVQELDNWNSELASIGLPIIEANKTTIMQRLTKQYLFFQLHNLLSQTRLAVLSARMVVSEHAAAKAAELARHLRLQYLTQRRHTLTQRQLASFSAHIEPNTYQYV